MSPRDKKLIFVTGASRSGTTLLSFVLRNQREVFGLKELHYFGSTWDPRSGSDGMSEADLIEAIADIYKHQAEGILSTGDAAAYRQQARDLIASLAPGERNAADGFAAAVSSLATAQNKSIPCERTPRNIFYAEALLEAFPNAHIVHMVRDPRAVMASQKKRWQRRGLATDTEGVSRYQSLRVWVNYHPFTIARMWRRATRIANDLSKHPRFTAVRFEDLVSEPEATVKKLCTSLGIDFEAAMLDVGRINSSHESSVGGAKRGLHADAIDKWRSALSAGEIAITERICAPLMQAYGFKAGTTKTTRFVELPYRLTYVFHLLGVAIVNPKRAFVQFRALSGAGKVSG